MNIQKLAEPGTVYLIGAGPGAPDLITVRGLRLLRQADVLVYDRLTHSDLLNEVRPDTELVFVGKEKGFHSVPQDEINRILIHRARSGNRVVRLKGGDPFVFGRGGEECLALFGAGIPFEIVPGITSAVAVPAFAGIPVTHRGVANSFTVVTGHACGSDSTDVDWEGLSNTGTLVVLMGLGHLDHITQRLITAGKSDATPVAVISNGTTGEQTMVTGTLKDIGRRIEGISSPATIVIGESVKLSEQLAWFTSDKVSGVCYDLPLFPNSEQRISAESFYTTRSYAKSA